MPECPEGCGKCCDPVLLAITPSDAIEMGMRFSERDRRWILHELKPLSRREGLRRAPHADVRRHGRPMLQVNPLTDEIEPAFTMFYECTLLDPVTKRCTDYENRPSACRDFPFGGDDETLDMPHVLPEGCVYVDDPRRRQ